jgi:hypothetical protein
MGIKPERRGLMLQSFQVGKTYRNRTGEYIVQSIDGDEMTIRYVGGGVLRTRVDIQARIWENIQFEEQLSREAERRQLAQEARESVRRRSSHTRRAKKRPTFGGFQESDFEAKKRGIAWSGRRELGSWLAHDLSRRTMGEFGSWIVPRQSEVHIARKEAYGRELDRNATFFVAVNEKGVSYGFRVGKPDGKPKANWDISAFLAALADDGEPRRGLQSAMKTYDLDLDVYALEVGYGQVAQVSAQDRGFLWRSESAEEEATQSMNWQQVVEYLQGVASDKQCDLFVRKRLSPSEALDAEAGVSSEIAKAFEALLPIYDASVGV